MSAISSTSCPTDVLPTGITLTYLRKLVGVSPKTAITIRYDTKLPEDKCCGLDWVDGGAEALLTVNPTYAFSPAALARAITHELLELSMARMWDVTLEGFSRIADKATRERLIGLARKERDRLIEERLRCMPFWSDTDVPIPLSYLEN